MSLFPIFAPSGRTVTLSGQSVTSIRLYPGIADAGVKVDNNGNMYRRVSFGAWTQIDSATDWVRPESAAPGLYEVRYTNLSGSALDFETKAEDTWHSLSAGDFVLIQQRDGVGMHQSDFDIEIRYNAGPVLASAAYSLTALVEI